MTHNMATSTSKSSGASKGKSSQNVTKTGKKQKLQHPLFEARPKNYGIGQDLPFKRDLTRFVKWPSYIQIQRKRAVLMKKLKIPPALNQFKSTLNKNEVKHNKSQSAFDYVSMCAHDSYMQSGINDHIPL